MNHRTHMYTKHAMYSKATALGLNIKMASESKNRDADSASTSDPPYYYVLDFYTLSDKVSDSKNLTFLCKLCPSEKLKRERFMFTCMN